MIPTEFTKRILQSQTLPQLAHFKSITKEWGGCVNHLRGSFVYQTLIVNGSSDKHIKP
ncbi:hypothetical protein HOLleu_12015 [Holothuria leucospilota]|uniref:Uncharacterized protein n=1 Tax=Holothuria leucospilota TaxID=206669 RepID=A0A9Q1HCR4_HOLLE|nr:hypothetical protein HOLleu_12015 [Holothuria leucospilota]